MKLKSMLYVLLCGAALVSTTGCYKDELSDFQKQIDDIKKTGFDEFDKRIKTVEEQVAAIEITIADLEGIREELDEKIAQVNKTISELSAKVKEGDDALKGDISILQESVKQLQQKQGQIDQKIADLKTYVNDELKNAKDWATATFATIEKMNEISQLVATIQTALNTVVEVAARHDVEIANIKTQLEKLEKVEENLKSWVNKQLEDYYNIAAIDAKLGELKNSYTKADETLKKELQDQIEDTYNTITEEYMEYVRIAIEVGGGEMGEEIQKQLKALKEELNTKMTAMTKQIEGLEARIAKLEDRVKTCEEQITGLTTTLDQLQSLYNTLDQQITALKNTVDGHEARIKALEDYKADLSKTIENLKKDLEKQIADNLQAAKDYTDALRTWTENALKNYYTQTEINGLIQEIKDTMKGIRDDLAQEIKDRGAADNALQEQIDNIKTTIAQLDKLEETIKTIVLANCYSKTEIDDKLAELKKMSADADTVLQKEIDQLVIDLKKAKEDLEAAYKKAIEDAIKEGGIIDTAIKNQIKAVTDRIDTLESRVDAIETRLDEIENRLDDLENSIKGHITSIVAIPDYSNGSVKVPFEYTTTSGSFSKKTAEIKYQVYPSGMAEKIAAAYAKDAQTVRVKYRKTISQSQSADNDFTAVAGCAKDASDADILVVKINGSDLGDDFYKTQFLYNAHQAVNMSLFIFEKQTQTYDVAFSTDYVELYPYCPITLAFSPAASSLGQFEWKQGEKNNSLSKDITVTSKMNGSSISSVGWKLTAKPSWVNVYPDENTLCESGSKVNVFLNVTKDLSARTGTLTFTSASGETFDYSITQKGRSRQTLTTNPTTKTSKPTQLYFFSDGHYDETFLFFWVSCSIKVTPSDQTLDWTWSVYGEDGSEIDWAYVDKSDNGSYAYMNVTVAENKTGSARKAYLKLIPATGPSGDNCPVFEIYQSKNNY